MKPQLTNIRKFTDSLKFMNLPVFDYINRDDFAIVRIEELGMQLPYQTPVFRPDHFSIILMLEGTATYLIGDSFFELGPNQILFSRPDVFISSSWVNLDSAYSINFSKEFLLQYCSAGIDEIQKFKNSKGCAISLIDEMTDNFESICHEIHKEALSNASYKYEIIANLIFHLLLLIHQQQHENEPDNSKEKNNCYVTSFINDLEDNFSRIASGQTTTILRLADYAQRQNLNETYLSKVVNTVTGKSVNQWIHEKLIEEIKYLLKYTDRPIRDIAGLYGFEDMNYFYNYFKRHTQIAPGAYRRDFNTPEIHRPASFYLNTFTTQ